MLTRTLLAASCLLSACVVGDEAFDENDGLAVGGGGNAEIRVVTHNIFKQQGALERVMAKAEQNDAHVVAMQELCPGQVAWLEANYSGKFSIGKVQARRPALQGCPLPDGSQETPYLVIMTRGQGGKVSKWESNLGGPAKAPGNQLVCMKFERGGVPVHACSVHLISGDWRDPETDVKYNGETVREQQTTGIKQIVKEWFTGNKNHFVILAGDFNSTPSMKPMDKIYDGQLGGDGDFVEYNRSEQGRGGGQLTVDARKIDYVFYSANRAPLNGPAVNVIDTPSDHNMVVSSVKMRK